MDFLKGKADEFSETGIGKEIGDMKNKLEQQARAWAAEKEQLLKDFKEKQRRLIMEFLQTKMQAIFDHAMDVAAEVVKDKIKDPYMPDVVQGLVDDLVDGIWPDLKVEMKEEILKGFSDETLIVHGEPACCGTCGPIAFFRYALHPYDRGVWRKIRHPVFWIFTILTLIPKWGVMQMAYVFNFLIIDKSDEFQLFEFILKFKALQFLTIGIINSCVGSIQYYYCVSVSHPGVITGFNMTSGELLPGSKPPYNACIEYAPRESFWTMILFFLQVIVVFIAFLMINCSEKKGGFYHQMEEQERLKKQSTASREGRMNALESLSSNDVDMDESARMVNAMRYANDTDMLDKSKSRLMKFLVYDFIVFILCIGLIVWLAFNNLLDDDAEVLNSDDNIGDGNWKFVMSLFWIKCFYGYMSFPFVFLKMPLISTLMTHAKPTGYNPYGNCVPYLGEEEDGPVPWDMDREYKDPEKQERMVKKRAEAAGRSEAFA